jgi:flagellar assembly factor FliW
MTIQVKSTRFGELGIEEGKIIYMPEGMVGFSESRFALLSPPNGPFHWLQAVDNPDLAFVVVDPKTVLPDYELKLTKDEYRKLELAEETETVVLALLTMAGNPLDITVNLLGPIVLNMENMKAIQVVLENSSYSTKHKFFPEKSS